MTNGIGETAFADDEITVSRRPRPEIPSIVARLGRPSLVEYLAQQVEYKLDGSRLRRADNTLAAEYENGKWTPYVLPEELAGYIAEYSRSSPG